MGKSKRRNKVFAVTREPTAEAREARNREIERRISEGMQKDAALAREWPLVQARERRELAKWRREQEHLGYDRDLDSW